MAKKRNSQIISVKNNEMQEWGCPYCGKIMGRVEDSAGGAYLWKCGGCNRRFISVIEGVETPPTIGSPPIKIQLQSHPRKGTKPRQ